MKDILLIPLGDIDPEIMTSLVHALENAFPFKASIGPIVEIPLRAFNPKRRQYHSTAIIEELSRHKKGTNLILAVADIDLYVPQLNFVFGEAHIIKGVAIISLARLRQEFYKISPDKALLMERAIKEAIHETGHLCGLDHCQDQRCIMFFSNSVKDTDKKGPGFCKKCRTKLGFENGHTY